MSETEPPASPTRQPVAPQIIRYAGVGVVSTATHYVVLVTLKEIFHVNPVIGTVIGYGLGTLVSYTLNRQFTFKTRPEFARGLAKFVLVNIVGMSLNALIMYTLTGLGFYYLLAQVIATGTVFIFNFTAARLFVFKR